MFIWITFGLEYKWNKYFIGLYYRDWSSDIGLYEKKILKRILFYFSSNFIELCLRLMSFVVLSKWKKFISKSFYNFTNKINILLLCNSMEINYKNNSGIFFMVEHTKLKSTFFRFLKRNNYIKTHRGILCAK